MILDDELELYVVTGQRTREDEHGIPHYTPTVESLGRVRAHVGGLSGTLTNHDRSPYLLGWLGEGEVAAIIPPTPRLEQLVDEDAASGPTQLKRFRAVWRGRRHYVTAVLPIQRHGRLHHLTLRLKWMETSTPWEVTGGESTDFVL